MKSDDYQLEFGRHRVAVKILSDWQDHKTADGIRKYDEGPIIESWPVANSCGYSYIKINKDMTQVVSNQLKARFLKQRKKQSFIKDFFSIDPLSQEEKDKIDREHVVDTLNPRDVYEITDTGVMKEPKAPLVENIMLDVINSKSTKKDLVLWLVSNDVSCDMNMKRDELMKLYEENR